MSEKASRDVLDWFRTYSVGKMESIGRTDITSNMNVSLNSDVRVRAAIDYLLGVYDDAWTTAQENITDWEQYWQTAQDEVWAEIEATMPTAVRDDLATMLADPDPNVRVLLKLVTVTTSLLNQAFYGGGG